MSTKQQTTPSLETALAPRTAKQEAFAKIEETIRENENRIVMSLAPSIPSQRFMAVAMQAITRSPKLLECTPASLVMALIDAAELGLEPSGLMGSAYLVPYRNKNTQRYEAKLIPGYRGLIDLARRSGEVRTVEAQMVRERDLFEYEYGTNKFLRHKPYVNWTGEVDPETNKLLDGGAYVAVYAIAQLATGEYQFQPMTIPEVNRIRARSKAADSGPWVTDYEAMSRKTPTRQLLKWLPLAVTALQRALELEDEAEGGAVESGPQQSTARRQLAESLHIELPEGDDADTSQADETDTDQENADQADGGQPTD